MELFTQNTHSRIPESVENDHGVRSMVHGSIDIHVRLLAFLYDVRLLFICYGTVDLTCKGEILLGTTIMRDRDWLCIQQDGRKDQTGYFPGPMYPASRFAMV